MHYSLQMAQVYDSQTTGGGYEVDVYAGGAVAGGGDFGRTAGVEANPDTAGGGGTGGYGAGVGLVTTGPGYTGRYTCVSGGGGTGMGGTYRDGAELRRTAACGCGVSLALALGERRGKEANAPR